MSSAIRAVTNTQEQMTKYAHMTASILDLHYSLQLRHISVALYLPLRTDDIQ